MQKIIKSNFFIVNNASNILTQDLNKKIAYNRVNKLNFFPNKFISLSLSPKPKLNKVDAIFTIYYIFKAVYLIAIFHINIKL